jgi:hypothetical protein
MFWCQAPVLKLGLLHPRRSISITNIVFKKIIEQDKGKQGQTSGWDFL